MKIDLNEEEWKLLKKSNEWFLEKHKASLFDMSDVLHSLESILKKLGSEWIDEEEEMRKFHMGFAYKPKAKDE